jgi:hypothetical protein
MNSDVAHPTDAISHDYNDQIGTPAVERFEVENSHDLTMFESAWSPYAYAALLRDAGKSEEDGAATAAGKRQSAAILTLDEDEYGLPIIPAEINMKGAELDLLIRSFLTIHYSTYFNL